MKRVQLSGAQKRKLAKQKEHTISVVKAKSRKLTNYLVSVKQQVEQDFTDTINPLDKSIGCSANLDTALVLENEICGDPLQSAEDDYKDEDDKINQAVDPGLWIDFSADDVAYWVDSGPNNCQHHYGPFDKSCRIYAEGKITRYCSQKLFYGTKANGEQYRREWLLYSPSTGSVYCFVCKLFASKGSSLADKNGFSDWKNNIQVDNHEQSATHKDCMLTYLTRRQGSGLLQKLEEQINEEYSYWEHVLRRAVAVICTIAERGLGFRGTNEKFGSLQNGNYLGLLELVSQFDPFLASHIAKYGNSGKGNPSYLSKTICEELIEIMSQKVHAVIVDEVKASGYFSLSVDSTPDISHIDQLSVVLRYVVDGEPIERFLTFLELQSHAGEGMAKQVLQYLREACNIDFSKCRGQSYDNAANMSGCYKGMQKKILEENEFAIYIPCAAHSLNLVGRSAVDSCLEAVNFFHTVQLIYTFFSASTNRWKILKGCLVNEKLVKSLSDTRWEAHAVATEAILKSHPQIIEALECLQEDQSQKGDTRREAENIAKKMQELEFAFMLVFWEEVLQHFHRVSQALQNEHVNLKTCADLYSSLADHLHESRNEFERFEEAAKEITPGVDYKSTLTRNRKRKTVVIDGDAPEVSLNARDKFRISAFCTTVDKLETEMSRRGQVYNDLAVRFSCLVDVPQTSQCCEGLINAYPEDLNNNLYTELQQFHSYIRHKFRASKSENNTFSHAELYKVIVRDNIECAFPNVEIALRLFLTLMVTNCSTERSFSQLKHTKNPSRSTMKQERLDSLSLLMIEADLLRKINFDDVLKNFARRKSRKKNFKM